MSYTDDILTPSTPTGVTIPSTTLALPPPTYVIKRDGRKEEIKFDKITARLTKLATDLQVDCIDITRRIVHKVRSGIKTTEIDNLAADTAASLTTQHPDYTILAARIAISNLHKQTDPSFSSVIHKLYNYKDAKTGRKMPLISDQAYNLIMKHSTEIDSAIDDNADMKLFSYFGFKTLARSYLLKINGEIVERPQYLFMRTAIGIHGRDIPSALQTYKYMSQGYFIHASPTLFNACTPNQQLSSCFLLTMEADSIEGIYDTLKDCAVISKSAGGLGLAIHKIRAQGSYIAGTNGYSNGLLPMLRVYNSTMKYVDQGGNKRPGVLACYLEPWHADIFDFLSMKLPTGNSDQRNRDLFYGLWIPDLFMKRVEQQGGQWTLMCPHECPGLAEVYGKEFEELYTKYEREGRGRKTIPAVTLWLQILKSQAETGNPYMLYKDTCNFKSNQKNLGTIQCSNLCTEIIEYSSPTETAVCNLASIALNRFVIEPGKYDFELLHKITKIVTYNLNRVIDVTKYPTVKSEVSNIRHRPLGIGVQGLADAFLLMGYAFDSDQARQLNRLIFETIYHGALEASIELAQDHGHYYSYPGSPASQGLLQYDLWKDVTPTKLWNWDKIKKDMKLYGLRNSLLVALMPTASTAQILGNNESIEPYTNNIYVRRVLSGEFQVVNSHLVRTLIKLNLWSKEMRETIIMNDGSIQSIESIPLEIRQLYRTVWEIPQKVLVDMAVDRGAFIDQSQSFNVHMAEPNSIKLTAMHFYGWRKGLKTGLYYLRTQAASKAIPFSIDAMIAKTTRWKETDDEIVVAVDSSATTTLVPAINDKEEGERDAEEEEEEEEEEVNGTVRQSCNSDDPLCLACSS